MYLLHDFCVEPCVDVECVSSYRLGKNGLGAVALLPLGADVLGMILGDGVLQSDAGMPFLI